MQELLELRRSIEDGLYDQALLIINDLEEMAKDDKINKIGSFLVILLLHLIKCHAEQRSTPSWRRSIRNSVLEIRKTNRRRDSGGTYLKESELSHEIDEYFLYALKDAADEAFEGKYSARELQQLIDVEAIKAEALKYILNGLPESEE